MFKLRHHFLPVLILLFFTACSGTRKITYFNDIVRQSGTDSVSTVPQLTIQPGDILQITITTIDKDVSMMFNPSASYGATQPGGSIEQGYLVDYDGNIELPVAGKIHVKGMTTSAINAVVSKELEKTIRNAYVSTRLVNFRVSVLGDVAKPGSYKVSSERASILDALSLAGDMNVTARRNDIMIIREVNGTKQYTSLDLNDSKSLSSPYYYLRNNDVVYVKPGPNRQFNNSKFIQLLPAIIGGLSMITTLIIVTK